MSENEDFKEYDEDDAIKYILSKLPSEISSKYSKKDILNVLDLIFDFYDAKGFFDISITTEEDSFEKSEMIEYVNKRLMKVSSNKISPDDLPNIVTLELEYEDTIDGGF